MCSALLAAGLLACDSSGGVPTGDAGSPVCGNGLKEADEVCDGDDLGGMTCAALGLDDGVLRCNATCDQLVTTGCGCTPACDGRQCGDDGCGGSCGTCEAGARCVDGACVPDAAGCTIGETKCADPGAFQVCARLEESTAPADFGPRVVCHDGNSCKDGTCVGSCGVPRVVFAVDRSSSLAGSRWQILESGLKAVIGAHERHVRFGLLMFPAGGGCSASLKVLPALRRAWEIGDALTPPVAASSTPLLAALDKAASAFGDPTEGMALVLISDGEETCENDPGDPSRKAEALARKGVRTYAVGIGNGANKGALDAIAASGSTGSARLVSTEAALKQALEEILVDLNGCPTSSPAAPCATTDDCGRFGHGCSGGVCIEWSDCVLEGPSLTCAGHCASHGLRCRDDCLIFSKGRPLVIFDDQADCESFFGPGVSSGDISCTSVVFGYHNVGQDAYIRCCCGP